MKKSIVIVGVAILLSITLFNCGGTKNLTKETGAVEIIVPFSGKEFQSDKENFRASQSGISQDLATSKKIALMNAKTELASSVQTTIKAVTDNYTNQRTFSDKQEFENKFEELSRQVTNQQLNDVKVIGEKTFKEKDGRFTYWVAIEMTKDAVFNQINSGISNDQKLQIDFDKFQYEKLFNEEMEKFENK